MDDQKKKSEEMENESKTENTSSNEEYFSEIRRDGDQGKKETASTGTGIGGEYYSEIDRTRSDDDHDLDVTNYEEDEL
jgi:hypothetical protein